MKLEIKSFRTKVARRIFILFIICTIVPLSAFALISFLQVRNQLYNQSKKSLQQETKSMAVSVYERLLYLRSEMRSIASDFESIFGNARVSDKNIELEKYMERFKALGLFTKKGLMPIYGAFENPPRISLEGNQHLLSGNPLLYHHAAEGDPFPKIYMCLALTPGSGDGNVVVGEIRKSYLWEVAEKKPPNTELYIVDQSNKALFSSLLDFRSFPSKDFKEMIKSPFGQFEWIVEKDEYIASYSSIFLKPNFYYPEWIVVLSKSKDDVLAPMDNFKKTFAILILFSFGLVFFLTKGLISKSLGPIEILKDAAKKISEGMYGHKVSIRSNDEFDGLGKDFNEMSEKLKEGQELLVHAAKMMTMGQMAAGVIHEIKQPLASIYGLLQLSMIDNSTTGEGKKRLETSMEAVNRLSIILERFKSFSLMSKETMEKISLNKIIRDIYEFMEHELMTRDIHCTIDSEENLPPVLGDRQGLQQVVSNLLVNAMHALEDKSEEGLRNITMKTYSTGEGVFFEIEDNGSGIPEEILEQIFDPFFTTKKAEMGMGLGMSIVESILHKHNARIGVESELGKGTKFTIVFPILSMEGGS